MKPLDNWRQVGEYSLVHAQIVADSVILEKWPFDVAHAVVMEKWSLDADHQAVIALVHHNDGQWRLDARVWIREEDGSFKPGDGLTLEIRHLPR
jgi:hypothetical protein